MNSAHTERGPVLLAIARAAIARAFGRNLPAAEDAAWLKEHHASFVTLTRNGHLRGCVGSLEARRTLLEDLKLNALKAAFHDTRFAPLEASEFDHIKIEVSVLSPLETLHFSSEQEALAQLRPGIDGVFFRYGYYGSTFLPVMWERLPDPVLFMGQLKLKAGLPADFWAPGVTLQRYTVDKWQEGERPAAPSP